MSLNIVWIPRFQNTKADYISNLVDYEDWQTTEEFFHFVDQNWGPHSIDRFASVSNTVLSRFNSLFWYPESEAVDAFTQNWRFEKKWLVPQIKFVCRTIKIILLFVEVMVLLFFQNDYQENTNDMSSMS